MGTFNKTFITLGILATIWLNWSCASIEQTEKADNNTENSKIVVSSTKSETVSFIPHYVFLDSHDNLSLYIQEDTILPKYHIRITKENKKVCNELINYAFLNNIELELKFNKLNQEVNSLKLTSRKEKTRTEKQIIIPIEPITIVQNAKETYSIKELISSYKIDRINNVIDIGIDFLTAQLAHYHFPINAFENSIDIIKKAFEKKLLAEFRFNPDTHEIVSIQFCNATEQTKKKLIYKKGHIIGPTECSTLTEEELKKVFSVISSYSCNNTMRPHNLPCIPFGYIEDGCFARAHAMRRILNRMGYECHKLFVYGEKDAQGNSKLRAGSDCTSWIFHVAIKLKVKRGEKGNIEEVIIDPSLFPHKPVTESEWLYACRNINCYKSEYDYTTAIDHTTETFGDVFSLTSPNEKTIRDPNYEITDYVCQNVMYPHWQNHYIELVRKNNPQLF